MISLCDGGPTCFLVLRTYKALGSYILRLKWRTQSPVQLEQPHPLMLIGIAGSVTLTKMFATRSPATSSAEGGRRNYS